MYFSLSPTMQETIQTMKEHNGKLIRWKHGFWTYEGCISDYDDLKAKYLGFWDDAKKLENPVFRNNMENAKVTPIWGCDVKTLRALARRELVILDEFEQVCILKNK